MGVSHSLVTEEVREGYAKLVVSSPLLSKLSDSADAVGDHTFTVPLSYKSTVASATFAGLAGVVADGEGGHCTVERGACRLSGDGTAVVQSLKWALKLLDIAGDTAGELAAVFAGSAASPLETIFGEAFFTKTASNKPEATFLQLCRTIDSRLLLIADQWVGAGDKVNMTSITAELQLVQSNLGILEQHHMIKAEWENEYVDAQGRRAPPWRRGEGDLAYIAVTTAEKRAGVLLVTAEGVREIGGAKNGIMDYSAVQGPSGEIKPSLHALLCTMSPRFANSFKPEEYEAPEVEVPSVGHGLLMSDLEGGGMVRMQEEHLERFVQKSLLRNATPGPAWASYGFEGTMTEALSVTQTMTKVMARVGNGGDTEAADGPPEDIFEELEDDADEADGEADDLKVVNLADLPPEHWAIQKRLMYLTRGNQTAALIALCSLRDYDLTSPAAQFAIKEKGLDLLVNLLETEDVQCKIAALMVLRDISESPTIKSAIADLDGMRPMVAALDAENDDELRSLAAATIANCAKNGRNRQRVRQYGGIEKLVQLLHGEPTATGENEMARCGALALWSCSKSKIIRTHILEAGALPLIARLMASDNVALLVPVVGVLVECGEQDDFRKHILEAGIVQYYVRALTHDDLELKAYSAAAMSKAAEEEEARMMVLNSGGLPPLVEMLGQSDKTVLMEGVTGAIWKCAQSYECKEALVEAKAVEGLTPLLQNQPLRVLINVTGAISELAAGSAVARKAVRNAGGIDQLVKLLASTDELLLVNVTKAVGSCAGDKDSMAAISSGDGVRFLWSLLKSENAEVQAGAAWAICPCIEYAANAGELVRSFVGGLELVVGLLRSEHIEVLASTCAAVSSIAKDSENLAVITDHGVVPLLSRLVHTTDNRLRCQLATAICECCTWGTNRREFGETGAVAPIVEYLRSADTSVHRATARALNALSQDADNCIVMHSAGVVKLLTPMVGAYFNKADELAFVRKLKEDKKLKDSDPALRLTAIRSDVTLQEAAATCIFNIRRLALVNELEDHK
eukprot:CAMPEP_0182928284 /NCGR_PEP_ID=MMETSP0105_2-20130417/15507_1 /TAXON_ID=81532 ORGANISM="Acanthoeca-like sp., Strain 10tr" /NCGR_SAMPLE_ID=MMETSP0105_2 /ASSEMBLY_ACC=CAM_ASM_000205 /LENGTH=1025 /DNA_ID=CAMNT_0025066285 /DNA_START=27 /DNA_END=3104 /DNA_ORIENTATION=+